MNETCLESTIFESTAVDLLFCLVLVSLFFLRAEPPPPMIPLVRLTTPSAAGDTFEIGASFLMRVGVFCFTGGLRFDYRDLLHGYAFDGANASDWPFFPAKGKCCQTIPKILLE